MIFSARGNIIWVLPSRNKINATQLTVAAGFSRLRMGRALQSLNITSLEYNGKPSECAMGTYINFDDGLKLCQYFGLEREPVAYFMKERIRRQCCDTTRESKNRLVQQSDKERSPDQKQSNERNEQEIVEDQQYDIEIEADLESEDGEHHGEGELGVQQTEDHTESVPIVSSASQRQQTSQHLSSSSVLKWHLGTSQLDRFSPHHVASGRNSFHRLDDSFDDLAVLFPEVSHSIVGEGR